ncbi:unnamed protein product [Camellia sinensis]
MLKKKGTGESIEISALISNAAANKAANYQRRFDDKPRVWCDFCNKPRHTRETCWKIHGKPVNWKSSKQGEKNRGFPTANEADSGPFNKEQIDQLLKLIKSNSSSGTPSVLLAQTVGWMRSWGIYVWKCYRFMWILRLSKRFPSIKFVADSLYPVVSGASIVAKVTRDRALRDWVLDETVENMHRNFGSRYLGDPETKSWLEDHQHSVFGFPTLVRFSWGTCTSYFKSNVEVLCVDAIKVLKVADIKLLQWRRKISRYRTNEEESILARITATGESNKTDEYGSSTRSGKRQLKLGNVGFTRLKRKSEEIESSGKGRCKFFQARKLEQLSHF